jgi:hypothetical protein
MLGAGPMLKPRLEACFQFLLGQSREFPSQALTFHFQARLEQIEGEPKTLGGF